MRNSVIVGTGSPQSLSFKICELKEPPVRQSLAEKIAQGDKSKDDNQTGTLAIYDYHHKPVIGEREELVTSYTTLNAQSNGRLTTALSTLAKDQNPKDITKTNLLFFVDPEARYPKRTLTHSTDFYEACLSDSLKIVAKAAQQAGLTLKVISYDVAKLFAGLNSKEVKSGEDIAFINLGKDKFTVTHGKKVNPGITNFEEGLTTNDLYHRRISGKAFTHIDGLIKLVPKNAGEKPILTWGDLLCSNGNPNTGLLRVAKHILSRLKDGKSTSMDSSSPNKAETLSILEKVTEIAKLKSLLDDDQGKKLITAISSDELSLLDILNPTDNLVIKAIQIVIAKLLAIAIKDLGINKARFTMDYDNQVATILISHENKEAFLKTLEGSTIHKFSNNQATLENNFNAAKIMARVYFDKKDSSKAKQRLTDQKLTTMLFR